MAKPRDFGRHFGEAHVGNMEILFVLFSKPKMELFFKKICSPRIISEKNDFAPGL